MKLPALAQYLNKKMLLLIFILLPVLLVVAHVESLNVAVVPTTYAARDRIWSGATRSYSYTDETSIGKEICSAMRNWPKNVCQINDVDGKAVTFEKGITWAIRIAQIFKKKGLEYPDVIGLAVRNSTRPVY